MKKSVLFFAVVLMIICVSMSPKTQLKAHPEICEVPPFTMKCDLVEAMKEKYENTQLYAINSGMRHMYPKGDAKAVWLSLDILKQFICQIENIEADGIRFYYTAYPDSEAMTRYPDLHGIPENYAERHTLVLVPTRNNNDIGQNPPDRAALSIRSDERITKNHGNIYPPFPLKEGGCD